MDEEESTIIIVNIRPLWWRRCPFKIWPQLLCWAGFGCWSWRCHVCCYYCQCCCSSKSASGSTHSVGRLGLLRSSLQQGKNFWLGRPAQIAWGIHYPQCWRTALSGERNNKELPHLAKLFQVMRKVSSHRECESFLRGRGLETQLCLFQEQDLRSLANIFFYRKSGLHADIEEQNLRSRMVFTMVGPGDFRQVWHLDIRSFSTVLLFKYLRTLHFAMVSNSDPHHIHE